jgi:protein-L-isoaspartate(D-aspartate) O-methyltransferase
MTSDQARLEEARRLFAAVLARVAGRYSSAIERAFSSIRREDFLPPGPWLAHTAAGYVLTPSADPLLLQQDLLFAIDPEKGINNGQPSLHAAWLAEVSPKPGERVVHVGCGNGFYSAILASLVGPMGGVAAFEIEPVIAASARKYLAAYPDVTLHHASATGTSLPASDIIYVNAASPEPLPNWLDALRPRGRLVFPWQADSDVGVSIMITKTAGELSAKVLGPSRFIPLKMDVVRPSPHRGRDAISKVASLLKKSDRMPDDTCAADFDQYWFSTSQPDVREGEVD